MNKGEVKLETLDIMVKRDCEIESLGFGCPKLDILMGKSLLMCGIVEIYGESGCGKTQIIMQIAIDYLYKSIKENKIKKILILSSGNFAIERLRQMARNKYMDEHDGIINRICIEHIKNVNDLVNVISNKKKLERNYITCIMIDSITPILSDELIADRKKTIQEVSYLLNRLNKNHENPRDQRIGVLCVNQLRASFDKIRGNSSVAALGLTWQNSISTRISISKTDIPLKNHHLLSKKPTNSITLRRIYVEFSSHSPNHEAYFYICQDGCIGVDKMEIMP